MPGRVQAMCLKWACKIREIHFLGASIELVWCNFLGCAPFWVVPGMLNELTAGLGRYAWTNPAPAAETGSAQRQCRQDRRTVRCRRRPRPSYRDRHPQADARRTGDDRAAGFGR